MDPFVSSISLIINNPGLSDAAKIEQIKAFLSGIATQSVQIGIIERLLTIPVAEGGYHWAGRHVNDVNFPTPRELNLEGARLEKLSDSYGCTLLDLEISGRRAADVAETLLYGIQNIEEQQKYSILALGQVWNNGAKGMHAVMLTTMRGRRRVNTWVLQHIFGFSNQHTRVLTLSMTAAEIAARDAKYGNG